MPQGPFDEKFVFTVRRPEAAPCRLGEMKAFASREGKHQGTEDHSIQME
jgi:hypothetical protein